MSEREKDVDGWLERAAEMAANAAAEVYKEVARAGGPKFGISVEEQEAEADRIASAILLLPSAVRALAPFARISKNYARYSDKTLAYVEVSDLRAAARVLSEIEALAARATTEDGK